MARKPYQARIGSISHGTMRTDDLLYAFVGELDGDYRLPRAIRNLVREANAWLRRDDDKRDDEAGSELVNDLQDALNELAPPYVYFGTIEGDGSDFGFWPALDSIQDAIADNELPRAGDVPKNYTGLAIDVNDHGNVTLFRYVRGKRSIVWDCV